MFGCLWMLLMETEYIALTVSNFVLFHLQYKVDAIPGSAVEHFLANLSHAGLYGFMVIMPASGIAMGYYGGEHGHNKCLYFTSIDCGPLNSHIFFV
jgi:cytochrome b561